MTNKGSSRKELSKTPKKKRRAKAKPALHPSIWPIPAKRRPLGWLDRLLTGLVIASLLGSLLLALAVNRFFHLSGATGLSVLELRGLVERIKIARSRLASVCPSEDGPLSLQAARLEDEREIQLAAQRHTFDLAILRGLAAKLSGFQRCFLQEHAAVGLLQVTPAMRDQTKLVINPFLPHQNLDLGLLYLRRAVKQTGSLDAALHLYLQEAKPSLSENDRRLWIAALQSNPDTPTEKAAPSSSSPLVSFAPQPSAALAFGKKPLLPPSSSLRRAASLRLSQRNLRSRRRSGLRSRSLRRRRSAKKRR